MRCCCNTCCLSITTLLLSISITYVYQSITTDLLTISGNTYGSHLACSIIFGTNRTLRSAKAAEFTFPPIKYGRTFDIDPDKKCVTATFFLRKDLSTTYCWVSDRLGCARLGTHKSDSPLTKSSVNSYSQPKNPLGEFIVKKKKDQHDCLSKLASDHFEGDPRLHSRALVVIQNSNIVFEKYKKGWTRYTRLHGWSMTKSILNTLIGIRIHQNKLSLKTTLSELFNGAKNVNITLHKNSGNITIFELLTMTDGLDIDEVYLPGSKVVQMLFQSPSILDFGKNVSRRQGGIGCFQYSSLATNYLSAALLMSFESKEEYLQFPSKELFDVLGMTSALIETDSQGIFIASSFSWMTARDWGRLAMLYVNKGLWNNKQILPVGWVGLSRTPTANSRNMYGMHFWLGGLDDSNDKKQQEQSEKCDFIFPERIKNRSLLRNAFPKGTMLMKGFEDQVVAISPESQTVVVRLGATKPVVIKWDQEKFYTELYKCLN